MAWSRYRHASVSATNPQALATCDRCGMTYNHHQLAFQHDWRGPRLQNLRILVCPSCMDVPQESGQRTIVLPPDPIPILNPRPDPHMFMGQSSSPDAFQSGSPNTIATEDGAPLLTEAIGSIDSHLLITEIGEPEIATALGAFIAVGKTSADAPSIMISPNGINWTEVPTSPLSSMELLSVAYGNGTWVAVGATIDDTPSNITAVILSSTDGINWTQRSSPAPVTAGYTLYGVTYGDSKFVAVGWNIDDDTGAILSSSDGITWTVATLAIAHLYAVTYGNGLYVTCGSNPGETAVRILTSPDAETWTIRSAPVLGGRLYAVSCNGSMFVAVGYNQNDTTPLILTSTDGITWVHPSYGFTGNIRLTAVAYGDNTWVIVGYNADTPNVDFVVFVSTDEGVNWLSRSDQNSNPGHPLGLAYSGATGSFVSVGGVSTPFVYLSADGQTWMILSSQFDPPDLFGPELVINGDFSSSSGWTLTNGASISGGRLLFDYDGSGTMLAQRTAAETITSGDYRWWIDIIDLGDNGANLLITIGAYGGGDPLDVSGPGRYTGVITTLAGDQLVRFSNSLGVGVTGGIYDNFSVKRVIEANDPPDVIYNAVAYGVATGQS